MVYYISGRFTEKGLKMTRTELINKAKEIGNKYYQDVKDSRDFGSGYEKIDIVRWSIAVEAMAELLNMSDEEYFETFFTD